MAIALKISPQLDKRLTALAEKTHRSKSFFARAALENYIEDLEDYFLSKSILENPGKIYSSEEVRKMCGLDD